MGTSFNIGDKVSFLNEKGTGIVAAVEGRYRLLVTRDDGFEVSVSVSEVVPAGAKENYRIDLAHAHEKDEKEVKPPRLERDEVWEVDLHLSEIVDSSRKMTDHEKLTAQLKYFRQCMDAAIAHRIRKIIFIHGVGKGTLKLEIVRALKQYDKARHYDAPLKKYGFGALVVEIL